MVRVVKKASAMSGSSVSPASASRRRSLAAFNFFVFSAALAALESSASASSALVSGISGVVPSMTGSTDGVKTRLGEADDVAIEADAGLDGAGALTGSGFVFGSEARVWAIFCSGGGEAGTTGCAETSLRETGRK
ncbi:MAG: hypothetical protein EXS37_12585 [Opitutus sp.]|nr:hypothetical protein [Opitutus sp.]